MQKVPAIPRATYRLQFHSGFRIHDAIGLVPYLARLGVSHVYASPLFQARPGSTHGYDVCDPTRLNPEIGTEKELEAFASALRGEGMGLVLDIVPNHMGNDFSNRWWRDVLKHGRESQYAGYFDIHWDAAPEPFRGKVMLPVLGNRYGNVLERGELKLVFEEGELWIGYYDKKFPVSESATLDLLKEWRSLLLSGAGEGSNEELLDKGGREGTAERGALDQLVLKYDPAPSGSAGQERMEGLLARQNYRLAYWRTGPEQLNYRRFFDITDLVAVKVESAPVFEAAHEFLFRLVDRGIVSGVRVDHPDGLWDPKAYFERLQEKHASLNRGDGPMYLLVEKILSEGEELPADWPVAGTTGYDWLNFANGLFVNAGHEGEMTRIYREFTGKEETFDVVVSTSKLQVLRSAFIGEMNSLVERLREIAASTREGRDFTGSELRWALEAVIVGFPVYRTYVDAQTTTLDGTGRAHVEEAVQRAKANCPSVDPAVIDFVGRLLCLEFQSEALRDRVRGFVMSLQQLTGPAMAKGLEDTTFYRYFRLVSLNEVGGHPGDFGVRVESFHAHNLHKQKRWPHAMLATATHDTKRGEDLRARVNVLSEIPGEWAEVVQRWSAINSRHRSDAGPSLNDEYLFYQTVAGAWTAECRAPNGVKQFQERVAAYLLKAAREAKLDTSWTEQNQAYEESLGIFVKGVLNVENRKFLNELDGFAGRIAFPGYVNSLAQVVLKVTSPGVPDFYQGTELWDFSLVDPDNRRPVNFSRRVELLGQDPSKLAGRLEQALAEPHTGEIKLLVTRLALQFRREHPELFERGRYVPLAALGPGKEHLVAFARETEQEQLVAIVPRLVFGLTGGKPMAPCGDGVWEDTRLSLPGGVERYRNVLKGELLQVRNGGVKVGEVLRTLPIAILHGTK